MVEYLQWDIYFYYTTTNVLIVYTTSKASEQMPNMRADSNYQQCWWTAATTWNITGGISSSSAETRTRTLTEHPSTHPRHISTSKHPNHTPSSNILNHLTIVHAYHFSEAVANYAVIVSVWILLPTTPFLNFIQYSQNDCRSRQPSIQMCRPHRLPVKVTFLICPMPSFFSMNAHAF